MDKVAIVGIDSLDPRVVERLRERLPNLARLMKESPTRTLESVFPPDSIPAWMSAFTGLEPAHHGVFYSYDVFDPTLSDLKKVGIEGIRGKALWDLVGAAGGRSVFLFPMLVHPPPPVRGVMVSKSPLERRLDWIRTQMDLGVWPPEAKQTYRLPDAARGVWGGYPGEDRLDEWAAVAMEILHEELDLTRRMARNETWDLFYTYSNLLDIVQHRLWRFFDPSDPAHRHQPELSEWIPRFHEAFDAFVGEFAQAHPDATLVVMSDHGHTTRPVNTVNLNEQLRRHGLLRARRARAGVLMRIRKVVLATAQRMKLEPLLIKLVTLSPTLTKTGKTLYAGTRSIDAARSDAMLSTFAGVKSYPHGGVQLLGHERPEAERRRLEAQVVQAILELRAPDGSPLVEWAKPRREVVRGPHAETIYPDILFQLRPDWGVGWEVSGPLHGRAFDHHVAPGGHAREGVFLLANAPLSPVRTNVRLVDVAPSVLDLMGLEPPAWPLDGRSLFRA